MTRLDGAPDLGGQVVEAVGVGVHPVEHVPVQLLKHAQNLPDNLDMYRFSSWTESMVKYLINRWDFLSRYSGECQYKYF